MAITKISVSKVLKTIVRPQWKILVVGLFLIVVSRLAGLVLPGAFKFLMDDAVVNSDYDKLWTILFWVAIAITIQSVTSFLLTRILGIEAHRIIASLRVEVQKKVLSLPMSFYDRHKSGELVQRIMNDVDGIRNLIGTGLVQLVGGTITTLVSLSILIYIDWEMTLYVLVPVIILGFIFMKAFSYLRPIFRKRREVNARVQGRLTETLGGISIIKGFNAEKQEISVFKEGVYNIFKYIKKSMTAQALVTSSATFVLGLTTAGIMGLGGHLIIGNNLSSGEFISFMFYLGFMIAPIVQMSNIGTQLTDAFSGLDRVEELMKKSSEGDEPDRTIELDDLKGHLVFKDVSFTYEEGKEVLSNISFDAKPGSVTALVGASGAGKSTIAGLVATHINPIKGVVTIDDVDLSKVTLESYRSQLGMVMQDDFLFEGTIRENILFSRPDATEEELEKAVESGYVNEFTDRFDEGLDTVVGERGVKLSGGQKQRVSIARAILADPKILILDEATSNLDVESEHMIQESLGKLLKGRTTIVIAHRLSTIRKADQILVVDDGEIKETGTHDELLEKKGKYYDLFTLQAKI